MITEPLTPLQEFVAERLEMISSGAKQEGGNGAMFRLMQRMDTINITEWIDEETKRGTTSGEIGNALSSYIANLITPWCLLGGEHSVFIAGELLKASLRAFLALMSGEEKIEVIAVHRHTGQEILGTAAGFSQNGVPKS